MFSRLSVLLHSKNLLSDMIPRSMETLSHLDSKGKAKMVDVGSKNVTQRTAVASAKIVVGPIAFKLVKGKRLSIIILSATFKFLQNKI